MSGCRDLASQTPPRLEGSDENPMLDRLDGVRESLQNGLEQSRFFNRTAPLHDPIFRLVIYRPLSLVMSR
jgi:hypothetical protein